MSELRISVARDFSPYPGPRYIHQGPFSGEKFRKVLVKELRKGGTVLVDLDGTTGFGSSFLDEAFGGLIRNEGFRLAELRKIIRIKSDLDRSYKIEAEEAMQEAEQNIIGKKAR
ncbi:STAS-like domain-containing protein [Rhodopseudomonas palustris]|uniref:STAS-like domain-containing protein n=1 Tax=Rhodopseudomonas palustris TaxID=1076 RepID=UPI0021F3C413|nr:STAS-like domain-containing protein [Rhodopseudomonas palustris]UYO51672.1 STAS-like domain-containing protein [Rhodopseudomonas palustris]